MGEVVGTGDAMAAGVAGADDDSIEGDDAAVERDGEVVALPLVVVAPDEADVMERLVMATPGGSCAKVLPAGSTGMFMPTSPNDGRGRMGCSACRDFFADDAPWPPWCAIGWSSVSCCIGIWWCGCWRTNCGCAPTAKGIMACIICGCGGGGGGGGTATPAAVLVVRMADEDTPLAEVVDGVACAKDVAGAVPIELLSADSDAALTMRADGRLEAAGSEEAEVADGDEAAVVVAETEKAPEREPAPAGAGAGGGGGGGTTDECWCSWLDP